MAHLGICRGHKTHFWHNLNFHLGVFKGKSVIVISFTALHWGPLLRQPIIPSTNELHTLRAWSCTVLSTLASASKTLKHVLNFKHVLKFHYLPIRMPKVKHVIKCFSEAGLYHLVNVTFISVRTKTKQKWVEKLNLHRVLIFTSRRNSLEINVVQNSYSYHLHSGSHFQSSLRLDSNLTDAI